MNWVLTDVSVLGGEPRDIVIRDGMIAAIGNERPGDLPRIDGRGLIGLPGLVDVHTHLREPGREDAETVQTGSRAAALGGYTAVCAMANTSPVADTAGVVEQVWRLGQEAGLVDVQPVGAVTVGLAGERLAELGAMADSAATVRIFSDDGHCVADPSLMRRALEYVKAFDGVIAQHAGHVGSRLHICHVSTAGSVELIRWAKSKGWRVTAEVTPHHLLLTDDLVSGYDPVYKVNPPLRTAEDVHALRAGLADGTIDCVATDHAPHAVEDKECEWSYARPGMVGLETALAIVVHAMGDHAGLRPADPENSAGAAGTSPSPGGPEGGAPGWWDRVAEWMSAAPARIARLAGHGQPLTPGAPANLTLFDPTARWTVEPGELASKGRNTPYAGMQLRGRVVATFLRGEATVLDGKVTK